MSAYSRAKQKAFPICVFHIHSVDRKTSMCISLLLWLSCTSAIFPSHSSFTPSSTLQSLFLSIALPFSPLFFFPLFFPFLFPIPNCSLFTCILLVCPLPRIFKMKQSRFLSCCFFFSSSSCCEDTNTAQEMSKVKAGTE